MKFNGIQSLLIIILLSASVMSAPPIIDEAEKNQQTSLSSESGKIYLYDWGDLVREASALREENRSDEAYKKYKEYLETEPYEVIMWLDIADYFTEIGKNEEAIEIYDKVSELSPSFTWSALYGKSEAYLNMGQYEDALYAIDQCLIDDLNEDFKNYFWEQKGKIFLQSGNYEEAILACDQALDIDPETYNASYVKGLALSKLGKYEDAIKAFDSELDLDINHEGAKKEREETHNKLYPTGGGTW